VDGDPTVSLLIRRPVTRDGRIDGPPDTVLAVPNYLGGMAISPNGRWIAYVRDVEAEPRVEVRPFRAGSQAMWRVSERIGITPLWTEDGRALTYIDPTGSGSVLLPVDEPDAPSFRFGDPQRTPSTLSRRLPGIDMQIHGFSAEQRPVMAEPTAGAAGGEERLIYVTGLERLLGG
jgi:hypothetical protein